MFFSPLCAAYVLQVVKKKNYKAALVTQNLYHHQYMCAVLRVLLTTELLKYIQVKIMYFHVVNNFVHNIQTFSPFFKQKVAEKQFGWLQLELLITLNRMGLQGSRRVLKVLKMY